MASMASSMTSSVVDVGRRVDHTEWDASSVDHKMALGALFALIRRIRSGFLAPGGGYTR